MKTGATFSPCRTYRYALWREWDTSLPTVVFCGLNPSTADETQDDPTIRRELGYAKAWGFGRYVKVNAYALRSTDPKGLWKVEDPYGPDNIATISEWSRKAQLFVAAWGNNIRPDQVWKLRLLFDVNRTKVHVIGLTKAGQPIHPLYQLKTAKPFLWRAA
jgi:hypothetical protein